MIKSLYKRLLSENKRIHIIQSFNKAKSFIYFGSKYNCNCCNRSFRKFLSKGNIKRPNAQCPHCGSLERTRLLHLYLVNETQIFNRHLKVLHIAPEACLFSLLKKADLDYIDGDINPALARNVVDITDIEYPDDSFDLIICSHVLGHIPDEAQAIKELYRVLKVDGKALIMSLINLSASKTIEDKSVKTPEERMFTYGEPDLCRLHGLDLSERLEQHGFVVNRIDYRKKQAPKIIEKNRLGDGTRELIFECRKK